MHFMSLAFGWCVLRVVRMTLLFIKSFRKWCFCWCPSCIFWTVRVKIFCCVRNAMQSAGLKAFFKIKINTDCSTFARVADEVMSSGAAGWIIPWSVEKKSKNTWRIPLSNALSEFGFSSASFSGVRNVGLGMTLWGPSFWQIYLSCKLTDFVTPDLVRGALLCVSERRSHRFLSLRDVGSSGANTCSCSW